MRRLPRLTLACAMAITLFAAAACGGGDKASTIPTTGPDAVLAAATSALESKHSWAPGSATVTLDGVVDSRFAHGGVRDATGSGALWFASLVDGTWKIVWDGNGIVDCASLEPYADYPASLLPQCVQPDGSLRARN